MAAARFIKICGLRSPAEALAAVAAGASAFGVLVGLTHQAADEADAPTARAIGAALPQGAELVLVTHQTDPSVVAALAQDIGARTIQVHGDMPSEGLAELRRLARGRRLLKAIHVTGPEAVAVAVTFAPLADALLLDSRTTDRLGGTGQTHDWTISRRIVEAVAPVPVILAGGLNPGNVAVAIAAVRPAGVDVNSGVEDAAGAKDPARLAAFVSAAWAALA